MIHVNLICRFCGTKYDDSYEFSEHFYGTVCPECRAIDEPRMKKETELRSEIIYILTVKMLPSEAIPIVDRILTLFREAGYEPPESVREMVEKSYADGVDDTEQKYKGWKSPEECTQCIYDLQGIGDRIEELGLNKEAT